MTQGIPIGKTTSTMEDTEVRLQGGNRYLIIMKKSRCDEENGTEPT